MKRNMRVFIAVLTAVLMMNVASAQTIELDNSTSFANYNFAIAEQIFNNTPGQLSAATISSDPLMITEKNQTIAVSLTEWGDDSRYGVIIKISNGSYSALVPLERGWGTQVNEIIIGNLKITVGLMDIYRGKNMEFAKLGIFITKNQ